MKTPELRKSPFVARIREREHLQEFRRMVESGELQVPMYTVLPHDTAEESFLDELTKGFH